MNALRSPALSESLQGYSSSEELVTEELTSPWSSPELREAKRTNITTPRLGGALNCTFSASMCLRSLNPTVGDSRMSFASIPGENSVDSPLGLNARSSFSSLPEITFPDSSSFISSNEGGPMIQSEQDSAAGPAISENLSTEPRKDRKARVISSYCKHMKGTFAESLLLERKNGVERGEIEEVIGTQKIGMNETIHQRGGSKFSEIGCPEGTEFVEGMSSTSACMSHLTGRQDISAEKTWNIIQMDAVASFNSSPVEKQFKDELEFSTMLTLAYVRVRDLTNNIDKAKEYLSYMEKCGKTDEVDRIRAEIQTQFVARAGLSVQHAKWRTEFTDYYRRRKKFLQTLKTRATVVEQTYFTLRKELQDLHNESATKPKRSWFSRICLWGFMK